MPNFAERLKELRLSKGLSQEALARAADMSLSFVSKLEAGKCAPSWSTVLALAASLEVEITAFTEKAKPQPKRKGKT